MGVIGRQAEIAAARSTQPPGTLRSLTTMVGHGLRSERRAPLIWGGGIGAMGALMAAIWPSIEGSIDTLMRSYPSSLKEAFGIQQLDSVEKYIDAEMLSLLVPLALAFFAVRCATRATVGAEDRGHLDTLLSLPLSRRVLVISSFLVTGLALAAILSVAWAMTWIAGTIIGTGISATTLAAGFANVWPLAMAFAGLAVLCAGLLHSPTSVTAIATATLIAMYLIDLVGKLARDLGALRNASAFRYYGSAIQDGLDGGHILALTTCGMLFAAVGCLLFDRRDIL